jgi:hypothetical protein
MEHEPPSPLPLLVPAVTRYSTLPQDEEMGGPRPKGKLSPLKGETRAAKRYTQVGKKMESDLVQQFCVSNSNVLEFREYLIDIARASWGYDSFLITWYVSGGTLSMDCAEAVIRREGFRFHEEGCYLRTLTPAIDAPAGSTGAIFRAKHQEAVAEGVNFHVRKMMEVVDAAMDKCPCSEDGIALAFERQDRVCDEAVKIVRARVLLEDFEIYPEKDPSFLGMVHRPELHLRFRSPEMRKPPVRELSEKRLEAFLDKLYRESC